MWFLKMTRYLFCRSRCLKRLQTAKEACPLLQSQRWDLSAPGLPNISITLESDTFPIELRTIQDFIVTHNIKPNSGVNEGNSFGGFVKPISCSVRPDLS